MSEDSNRRGRSLAARVRSRRGALTVLATGVALAGLALAGVVPAGAEGEDVTSGSEDPAEPTAPPDITAPPDTTALPDTTVLPETTLLPGAPPENGLKAAIDAEALANVETPADIETPGDIGIFAFGDECQGDGQNSWESDSRADPGGQCTYGNIGQGNDAAVLAQCQGRFEDATNFFNSGTGNSSGNDDVFGTISPHPHPMPPPDFEGEQLNVTADPGVVIDGVFVKGGNAFNAYIGNDTNMLAPLTGGAMNFSDISHFVICYHFEEIETGSLDVVKELAGDGSPDPQTEFTVEVDCTDDSFDTTLTFDASGMLIGGSLPIANIPLGTDCEVEETGQGGANAVTYDPDGGTPADPPTVTITTDGETVTVTITNTFDELTGSLDVVKELAGDGSPDPQTEFTVEVDCTDDSFDTTLTFDASGTLTGGSLPIENIPLGTDCEVEETGQGGANAVTYDPDGGTPADPPTVTITTEGETVTVTVTNTFDAPRTGGLNVTKSLVGPVPQAATFTIEVDCTDDSFDTTLVFDAAGVLTSGTTPIEDIPLGTECTVTETGQGDADGVTYTPNGGTPVDPPTVTITTEGETVAVTVTNTFDEPGPNGPPTGAISVEKAVGGTPPAGAVYTVQVACTDGTIATLNFGANGGTQVLTGIPILPGGTSCTIEETGQGGASQVSYSPQNTTFTLTVQSPARVLTVTNIFDPQTIGVGRSAPRILVGTLPFTGGLIAGLVKVAVWLLALGSAALLVGRHRRRRAVEA